MKKIKQFFSFAWEVVKIAIIALAIVVPIRLFLFQPFFVRGESMEPTLEDGDYLIIDEISYYFREPKRGEVIVFKYPQNSSILFIKRIIGLPGETIEIKDAKIFISKNNNHFVLDESYYLPPFIKTIGDIKVELEEDEYFVLGDNRSFSYDSRKFGVLKRDKIIGRVLLRAWPIFSFKFFGKTPEYLTN